MLRYLILFPAALALAACDNDSGSAERAPQQDAAPAPPGDAAPAAGDDAAGPTGKAVALSPQEMFLQRIADHCGRAYEGRIVANEPAQENDPLAGEKLVMHVRECSPDEIKIPFHVGDDHSRTWVITRVAADVPGMDGLRLEHDHRNQDGTPHEVTMYGGDTADAGTATRQEFPASEETRELFAANDLAESQSNVWAIEIEPDRFLYELSRPEGRLLQVEFDLTAPVPAPPAPWGHELVKVPEPESD